MLRRSGFTAILVYSKWVLAFSLLFISSAGKDCLADPFYVWSENGKTVFSSTPPPKGIVPSRFHRDPIYAGPHLIVGSGSFNSSRTDASSNLGNSQNGQVLFHGDDANSSNDLNPPSKAIEKQGSGSKKIDSPVKPIEIDGELLIPEGKALGSSKQKSKVVKFQLRDMSTKWVQSKDIETARILLSPELTFVIFNSGTEAIDYLSFKIVFLEKGTKVIFDESEEILRFDIPLEPGYTSKVVFIRTSRGFENNQFNEFKIRSREFDIKIYLKPSVLGEWKWFSDLPFPLG